MSYQNIIKEWAAADRPREKLLQKGPAALTDAELLAILIATGVAGENGQRETALDVANKVLDIAHRHLHELGRLSVQELQQVKGIGQAKAITIAAALEIGRRRQVNEALQRPALSSSTEAANVLMPYLGDLNHETFMVLYLNHANKLLRHEKMSDGGMTGTVADVRLILKNALLYNANKMIVAHNHPSGNLQPSQADKVLTEKIKQAAALMDIQLLDHLIIANNTYLSLADEGLM